MWSFFFSYFHQKPAVLLAPLLHSESSPGNLQAVGESGELNDQTQGEKPQTKIKTMVPISTTQVSYTSPRKQLPPSCAAANFLARSRSNPPDPPVPQKCRVSFRAAYTHSRRGVNGDARATRAVVGDSPIGRAAVVVGETRGMPDSPDRLPEGWHSTAPCPASSRHSRWDYARATWGKGSADPACLGYQPGGKPRKAPPGPWMRGAITAKHRTEAALPATLEGY